MKIYCEFKVITYRCFFSPPDPKEDTHIFLLSNETSMHLALLGSLPNQGITHVRIHWLLNLLQTIK